MTKTLEILVTKKKTLEILFLVFAWIVLAWCLLQIAMMDQAWPV